MPLYDCGDEDCSECRQAFRTAKRTPETPRQVVDEQANDENLWFEPVHITEDILQKALRRLHEAVEGKTARECAIDALTGKGVTR